MRLICVDLELNKNVATGVNKIIQIGAVCFEPDKGKIVDIFNMYVDPKEPLDPFIINLCNISEGMVCGMPSIWEAAIEFSTWKAQHQANAIAITWGGAGSKSNDVSKIYEESGVDNPFDKRIIDVKGIYQMLANASNAEMRSKVGLGKALTNVGLKWCKAYGSPHNALGDAANTMALYMYLSKCLKGGHMIKQS